MGEGGEYTQVIVQDIGREGEVKGRKRKKIVEWWMLFFFFFFVCVCVCERERERERERKARWYKEI